MAEARARAAPLAPLWRRWAPVALWLALGAVLVRLIPEELPAGPRERFGVAGWTLSDGLRAPFGAAGIAGTLRWQGRGPGPHTASRRLSVSATSPFLEVEACIAGGLAADRAPGLAPGMAAGVASGTAPGLAPGLASETAPGLAPGIEPGMAEIMLSSIHRGRLDFNRAYRLGVIDGAAAGECLSAVLPRRAGDGPAVLQIQLLGAAQGEDKVWELALSQLSVQPWQENPAWRWTRRAMLPAGIALLAIAMAGYARRRPPLCVWAGLLVVAGILFGCCVSVSLKADIYAVLTGGRSLPARLPAAELLRLPFPIGGFPVFTCLHALLFGLASLLLGLARRRAWQDLMLLGLATEALQVFVPGRGPGFHDMLVDWSGVLCGLVLSRVLRPRRGFAGADA